MNNEHSIHLIGRMCGKWGGRTADVAEHVNCAECLAIALKLTKPEIKFLYKIFSPSMNSHLDYYGPFYTKEQEAAEVIG